MQSATGIDNNDLDVGIGLCSHAGDGVDQRGPVHAADDDADQGQLLRCAGQLQGVALKGPAAQAGGDLVLGQCLGRQLPIGFGCLHAGSVDKRAHCGHGLGMAAVGVALFLGCKGFQRTPLAFSHGADVHHGVGLRGRTHLIKQQGDTAMALGCSHARQCQCLVVGMGLGESRQQKPAGLMGLQCPDDAVDQRRCMAQFAVCKVPANGRLQAQYACCSVRFC